MLKAVELNGDVETYADPIGCSWAHFARAYLEDVAIETFAQICSDAQADLRRHVPLTIYWYESPRSDLYAHYARRLGLTTLTPAWARQLFLDSGLPPPDRAGISEITIDTTRSQHWFIVRTNTRADDICTRIVARGKIEAEIDGAISNGVAVHVVGPQAGEILQRARAHIMAEYRSITNPDVLRPGVGRPRKTNMHVAPPARLHQNSVAA